MVTQKGLVAEMAKRIAKKAMRKQAQIRGSEIIGNLKIDMAPGVLKITDLTNAGWKDKAVSVATLKFSPVDEGYILDMVADIRKAKPSFRGALEIAKRFTGTDPNQWNIGPFALSNLRGLDVAPLPRPEIETLGVFGKLRATTSGFIVSGMGDGEGQTLRNGSNKAALKFYLWFQENQDRLLELSFTELWAAMIQAGIQTDHKSR